MLFTESIVKKVHSLKNSRNDSDEDSTVNVAIKCDKIIYINL